MEINVSYIVNDAERSKENHREVPQGRRAKTVKKKKKKIRATGRKTKKSSAKKHQVKKHDVSDIFS